MATFPQVLTAPGEGGRGKGVPRGRHDRRKQDGALCFVSHQKIRGTSLKVPTTWRAQAPTPLSFRVIPFKSCSTHPIAKLHHSPIPSCQTSSHTPCSLPPLALGHDVPLTRKAFPPWSLICPLSGPAQSYHFQGALSGL